MKCLWLASAALVVASACTSAPAPGQPAPAQAAPSQAAAAGGAKEEKICESKDVVGRKIPVKTCKTAAEWEAERKAAAEGVRNTGRAVQSTSNLGGGPQ